MIDDRTHEHEAPLIDGREFGGMLAGIGLAYAVDGELRWLRQAGRWHPSVRTTRRGTLGRLVADGLSKTPIDAYDLVALQKDGGKAKEIAGRFSEIDPKAFAELIDKLPDRERRERLAAIAAATPRESPKDGGLRKTTIIGVDGSIDFLSTAKNLVGPPRSKGSKDKQLEVEKDLIRFLDHAQLHYEKKTNVKLGFDRNSMIVNVGKDVTKEVEIRVDPAYERLCLEGMRAFPVAAALERKGQIHVRGTWLDRETKTRFLLCPIWEGWLDVRTIGRLYDSGPLADVLDALGDEKNPRRMRRAIDACRRFGVSALWMSSIGKVEQTIRIGEPRPIFEKQTDGP